MRVNCAGEAPRRPKHPSNVKRFTLGASGLEAVVAHGHAAGDRIAELERHPDVIRVWHDTPIGPFGLRRQTAHPAAAAAPASRAPGLAYDR